MALMQKVLVVDLNNSNEYQKLLDGEPQTCGMRSGRVHLTAGKSCGQHSTRDNEEMLIFLTGKGDLQIGEDQLLHVGGGKVAYIPPNTLHDVKNTGTEALVYIYCVAPAK
jgi:mannose-6-phosphate isomerase-like protein (cupin superfamily)